VAHVLTARVLQLSGNIGDISPLDEAFSTTIWWLQRASLVLDTTVSLGAPFA
jgi:hypothetical protein